MLFVLFCQSSVLLSIFPRQQGFISTTQSSLPMPTLVYPSHQLTLAMHAFPAHRLLIWAKATKHGGTFYFLMGVYRLVDMALITGESSTTASISNPSKTKFHMLTCPFIWQLLIILHQLVLFKERVRESQSHIWHLHLPKTLMAISI